MPSTDDAEDDTLARFRELTAGWSLFLGYLLAGILACLLVVTIPFGLASFRIAGFVIWPFGQIGRAHV